MRLRNLEHVMAVAIILSWLLIFFVQRRYIMKRFAVKIASKLSR